MHALEDRHLWMASKVINVVVVVVVVVCWSLPAAFALHYLNIRAFVNP